MFSLFALLYSALSIGSLPLTCNSLTAETKDVGKINLQDKSSIHVVSQALKQIQSLLGEEAQLSFGDCHFDNFYQLYLPANSTGLISFSLNLNAKVKPSTVTFDASTFAKAHATSQSLVDLDLYDSKGSVRKATLYFRKRLNGVWEYYLLTLGSELSNYAEGVPTAGTVILEIGAIHFDTGGNFEHVDPWYPGENSDDDHFFSGYQAKDPTALQPNEFAYDATNKIGVINWKDADPVTKIQLDYGQFSTSTAIVTETNKNFRLYAELQDGRPDKSEQNSQGN